MKSWQAEAGGQLFARIRVDEIRIEKATGPRKTDRRTRTSYRPDRAAEQREINQLHKLGLHYVGDWHTHPSARPVPSATDMKSIAESVTQSTHDLHGFIMIIVGTDPKPDGLRLSLHDGWNELILSPTCSETAGLDAMGRRLEKTLGPGCRPDEPACIDGEGFTRRI